MSPETTNIISNVIVAIFTLITTILVTVLLRKRKVIQFDVFSMPLLRFKPKKERNLVVSIDKSVITGNEADRGDPVSVTSAFGFEIDVRNVGNEDVTDACVEIKLPEGARIIELETLPRSRTGYQVSVETDSANPNVRRVLIPYINRGDRFLIRIISTGNENRECKVVISGLGIQIRRHLGLRLLFLVIIACLPTLFLILVDNVYPNFLESLGAVRETTTITNSDMRFPGWLLVTVILFCVSPTIVILLTNGREIFKPRRVKEAGAGVAIKVQDWDLDDEDRR